MHGKKDENPQGGAISLRKARVYLYVQEKTESRQPARVEKLPIFIKAGPTNRSAAPGRGFKDGEKKTKDSKALKADSFWAGIQQKEHITPRGLK